MNRGALPEPVQPGPPGPACSYMATIPLGFASSEKNLPEIGMVLKGPTLLSH